MFLNYGFSIVQIYLNIAKHLHGIFSPLHVVKHWCRQKKNVKNNEINKHV
jgi:hypothetical protein